MRTHSGSAALLTVALVGVAGCSSGIAPEDREPTLVVEMVDVDTELPANVTLTFQVRRLEGDPVPSIPPAAFTLLDNGEPPSASESESEFLNKEGNFITSVVLLLDLSGSITETGAFASLKSAVGRFIDGALTGEGVAVSIWWFDGEVDIVRLVDFTDDAAALKAAVDALSSDVVRDNATNLNGAIPQGIETVQARFSAPGLSDVLQAGALVIFTDGSDTAAREGTSAAEALSAVQRASDVDVYTIGLRGDIDEEFLTRVGKSGSVFADNTSTLLTEFATIGGSIRDLANSFYILQYCSPRRSGASNELTVQVEHLGEVGEGTAQYSASGFRGGCVLG